MDRILIIGSCGAGKSTMARKLATKTQLPIIHLDQHYWKPGWTEPEVEEWEKKVSQLIQAEQWIMDGNYSGTFHLRMPRADTIIFLDFSRWRCLWQILLRWWKYLGTTRPDLAENCPEHLSLSFLHYVFVFPITHRPRILTWLKKVENSHRIIRLANRKEVNNFLENLID